MPAVDKPPETMKTSLPAILTLIPFIALANDAAMNDGAAGPEPIGWRSGEESIVQMKREALDIRFGTETTHVVAKFTFLSHKKGGPATQKLGFPDDSRSELDGDVIGPIENLVTRVDGEVVDSELVEGWYRQIVKPDGSVFYEQAAQPSTEDADPLVRKYAWHVVEVVFPEGREVVVERTYDCPSGIDTSMNAFFHYETRTGGAWRGEIEELVAAVSFDDTVRTDLVSFDPRDGWSWDRDRTTATLVWKHFEPRTDEGRQYFSVNALDLGRLRELIETNEGDIPPLEAWIRGWKERNE